MKPVLSCAVFFVSLAAFSQGDQELSIFDARKWGLVMEHPDMKKVVAKKEVTYFKDDKAMLAMDVYMPPNLGTGEKRPAVIFLNAIGDAPGQMKVKSWGIYTSWPQYIAANGMVGISMDCDGGRIQESIAALFAFIDKNGAGYHIDAQKLGVYAASANVTQSMVYLMKPDCYAGIKAAAMYYGGQAAGPYRKDLPVLFMISEGDVRRNGYTTLWNEVLKNNAPWTIKMGSGLPHAFDAFSDNDEARTAIKETLSFWKNHLDPIPKPSWPSSTGRSILAAQFGHDDAKTVELLKTYLGEHPDDNRAQLMYGSALKSLGRFAEAEGALKKGVLTEPDNIFAESDLVVVLYAVGKSEEADKLLAKMTAPGPLNKFMYHNMAFALFGVGKHKEGVPLYEKAVELDPGNALFVYNLSCGYAMLHETDKAFASLGKSIELGMTSKAQINGDPDLESLRSDKRYQELQAKLR